MAFANPRIPNLEAGHRALDEGDLRTRTRAPAVLQTSQTKLEERVILQEITVCNLIIGAVTGLRVMAA